MSAAEDMVRKYSVKEAALIKKVCEPLRQYLDVEYFWYSHTTADGGYFSIGSNPSMHEYYHAEKCYHHSPFHHNPQLIQPGFYSYRSIPDPKFQAALDGCANAKDINLGMGLVMKQGKDLMRFGYAGTRAKGPEFADRIVNNLPLLKKFNNHFLSEIKELLKTVRDNVVDLPSELGSCYNKPPKGLHQAATCYDKALFLNDLGLLNAQRVALLTPRELECLKYMHEGYSAREIAETLGLKTRTIEFYLENIKLKTDCDTRSELFQFAQLLSDCGYF
jgi:DNA-binding CsgD family transcriptional regulator